MTDFLQLHLLTAYPPANLNRDDTGRPKTAIMGGVPRLRVSSQSLKRSWRESDVFQEKLAGHMGDRTKKFGLTLRDHMIDGGMGPDDALRQAGAIANIFGKLVSDKEQAEKPAFIEQLVFISPQERQSALALADEALAGKDFTAKENMPEKEAVLQRSDTAADIAMFGRMLADDPKFNREAAVQVAHAISTHRSVPEDDYFTAVDDLTEKGEIEDLGAAHIGVREFGSGLFYLYICVDRDLLTRNLELNTDLADSALNALIEAAATVSPRGMQASFASRARASYIMAERGDAQPRSLAAAFLKPVADGDTMTGSIEALEDFYARLANAYGEATGGGSEPPAVMNVLEGRGTLAEIKTYATRSIDD